MNQRTIGILLALALALLTVGACGLVHDSRSLRVDGLRSIDGLDRADIPLAGTLELRENHRIGGYDRLLISPATLTYTRESLRLTSQARRVFLSLLRESLVEASEAAGLQIVTTPDECTMTIDIGALGMELALDTEASQLARMTVVMQFRDTMSGEALLRYSTDRLVDNPEEGVKHDAHLKAGLDRIVADLNLDTSLRGANLADDTIRPGCNGTLAALGRAAQERR